ncbi:hypothetical protein [Streptomyces sp. NPDC005166]
MALIAAQPVTTAGLAPTYTSASAGGDQAPVGGGYFLEVRNGGGASITVTVVTPGTYKGFAIADAALVIPAAGSGVIPLDSVYRNPSTGRADITYSAVTSVTVGVLQVG